ncbi:MAG: hypothetical protein JO354_11755 [Verrucomicrobia bacterium]|nr:hypothetical protein [Verrucomicrobiota bacterium]
MHKVTRAEIAFECRRLPVRSRQRWVTSFVVVLALIPPLLITYLIASFGVNIPYTDEWSYAPFLLKAYHHTATLDDYFAQHNEHRVAFPKLFLLLFARLAHGDVRAQMFFSVALAAGTLFNIALLLRRTFPPPKIKPVAFTAITSFLVFSPVQAENWLWGFQFCLFLIVFLLTCGICVATSTVPLSVKFVCCLIISFVATFSFGSGLLLWLLTFPLAFAVGEKQGRRRNTLWLVAWSLTAATAILFYAHGYTKPPYHPPLAASRNIFDYYFYVAGFLGAPLYRSGPTESVALPVTVGTLLLLIYFLGVANLAKNWRRSPGRAAIPWLALGAFSFLSGGLAAVTRIGFGVTQALDSRYTTLSLPMSVTAIILLAIPSTQLRFPGQSQRLLDRMNRVEASLFTLLAILFLTSAWWGIAEMADARRMRLWGKAALHFGAVLDTSRIYQMYLHGDAAEVLKYAKMEDSIGLLRPPLATSARIAELPVVDNSRSMTGFIGPVDHASYSGIYNVTGWAILPPAGRVADAVALSSNSRTEGERIFAINDQLEDRPDVVKVLHRPDLLHCGWRASFSSDALPDGTKQLAAWAMDANSGRLYRLGGTETIR